MSTINRRTFLSSAAAAAVVPSIAQAARAEGATWAAPRHAVAISSGNGLRAVTRAVEGIKSGEDPVVAVVEGVTIVELDEKDMSVGYGGLPNEEGVVQLDSSVMHGPTHKAGAVGAIENIRTPARVALKVLQQTDHVMIVGEGALKFARAHGFPEENTLTDKAREAWLKWKRNGNPNDDWLDDEQAVEIPHTYGTIHCAAVNTAGDVSAVTTTSGLSYKIPGRVGDSPIIGAGMFVDNEVGAAGATGRGEAVIQSCGAFQIVHHMGMGDGPEEACKKALRWIATHTRRRDLMNAHGEPNFNVTFYALRKDGTFGSACMRKGGSYAIHDGADAQRVDSPFLFG